MSDIRDHFSSILYKEGVSFAFKEVESGLDSFMKAVRKERDSLSDGKPIAQHPNILIVMTCGISNKEIEESISRYIPRSDIFPCEDTVIQTFVDSTVDDSYVHSSSPGILDWQDNDLYGLNIEEDSSPSSIRNSYETPNHPSSPSIGQPVRFPNIAHFARLGTVFHHHYNAAGGECPGRATLLTGQLPPIHGVRTSLEKTGERSELKVDEVPTMGHYFSAAGYDVVYKGEWGLSQLQALQEHPLLDLLGVERDSDEDLQPFGFQGWEAHKEEDWYERASQTTNEALEYIRRRESVISEEGLRGNQPPPWSLIVSYPDVLPDMKQLPEKTTCPFSPSLSSSQGSISIEKPTIRHIQSSGNLRKRNSFNQSDVDFSIKGNFIYHLSTIEKEIKVPTNEEIPSVQKLYREHCSHIKESDLEEKYANHCHQLDCFLGELFQEVLRGENKNTVIILTSVAGNLIGDHGMWGSCYNGYEEAIRIPCICYLPQCLPLQQRLYHDIENHMTSSIDILPTLLHIAGIQETTIQNHLYQTHHKVPCLVGNDLCCLPVNPEGIESIYYQNEDVAMPLTRIPSVQAMLSSMLDDIPYTDEFTLSQLQRSVTTVIARVKEEEIEKKWKICYYSSDPRSCCYVNEMDKKTNPCEWELYDLLQDPHEV